MTSNRGLRPALGLFAYFLVGVLCTVLVVNTLRVPIGWGARAYGAEFTDVGGLGPGSEVTVAGVRVGRVVGVGREVGPGGDVIAVVHFEVERASPVTAGARASIRYGDMLGIRYLSLDPPPGGGPAVGGPRPCRRGPAYPWTPPPIPWTSPRSSTGSNRCSRRYGRRRSTRSRAPWSPRSRANRVPWMCFSRAWRW